MRYYSAKLLSNIFKVVVLTLLILFSFCSCFSQGKYVDRLIQELNDKDPIVRRNAADALGPIKDAPAVEPLIAALKDEDSSVRSGAAGALGSIKDARAVEPLMAALKDENLEIIAGAYSFFIQKGASGSEALLIKALDKYGTRTLWMAQDFLSCGNDLLVEAVKNWALKYGYIIHASPVTHSGPIWGR